MSRMTANILVIDDEVGMREGCRRALTPQGYQVDVAEHGVEGLRKLREGRYDLVLLDAMMPGPSGLELLERIQEHDSSVICIMITGYATVDLAAQAMKHGAHDFLPKPFTADELLTVVEQGLGDRQLQLTQQKQRESEEEALQLRRTRQEIAKLEAIESRFMLVIVHELRNPAGVIKNCLQLMRGGYVDGDEWDEYLAKVDGRAGQLLRMLDDLLELAHLKEMLNLSKLRPVAAVDVLEKVINKLQPQVEAKGLALEREIQALPTILAQPAHLDSLWTNLIENAISYTPSGRVTITLDQQQSQMVTVVSDTGIGISTEDVTRIFQDFYRSEAAKAEVELGTGLGLPIVNQVVQIYQGTIRVDSVPGQGSSFTVSLPLAVSDVEM